MERVRVESVRINQVDWTAIVSVGTMGAVVLLAAGDDVHYYDEQVVKKPEGSRFRQVGTYRYKTEQGFVKTVPAVALIR